MEIKRKSFQGLKNILNFNWHFYVIGGLICIVFFHFSGQLHLPFQMMVFAGGLLGILTMSISLVVSYLVYDRSDLYQLKWLPNLQDKSVLMVNAGFDEGSDILKEKFPKANLTICDFYDPNFHTEVSIKRARRLYPSKPNSISVSTEKLPFEEHIFDHTIAFLSIHEIRKEPELAHFLKELGRVTNGKIFVTEHLRDSANFLAYSFGFFHFHSKNKWLRVFQHANLELLTEQKTTPFITTFSLQKNGKPS